MKLFIKYIIFLLTPHLFFDRIASFFSKEDDSFLREILNEDCVYVFLGCDYSNLGDYAITLAQREMLQDLYPNKEVHVVTMGQTYSRLKAVVAKKNSEDIITLIGGGNMSELYYGYERKRNFIVSRLKENKIISFPQSMIFGNTHLGKLALKRSEKTYKHHSNLLILAREEQSFRRMKESFPFNKVELLPDIVMTMDKRQSEERSNIILSIRKDYESNLSQKNREFIINTIKSCNMPVVEKDTTGGNKDSNEENFEDLLSAYSKAKLVITDRLHGMIFSYITGTPSIVLPNNNGKIKYSYKWIKDCNYIKFIEEADIKDLPLYIKEMFELRVDDNDFSIRRQKFIEMYKKILL